MRRLMTKLMILLALLVLLGTTSCTSNDLDASDSADVIMLIQSMTTPEVVANRQAATTGTCAAKPGTICTAGGNECGQNDVCNLPQTCVLTVEEWSANIEAAPKNSMAIPPFNNIEMMNVTITYNWTNPAINALPGLMGPYVAGLGNVTIPADGTNSVRFVPIASDVLNQQFPNMLTLQGASANLTLQFVGMTVEGTQIVKTAQANLVIAICT